MVTASVAMRDRTSLLCMNKFNLGDIVVPSVEYSKITQRFIGIGVIIKVADFGEDMCWYDVFLAGKLLTFELWMLAPIEAR